MQQPTGRRGLVSAALIIVLLLGTGAATLTRHDTDAPTRYLTDDHGRALFLHGFNTSGSAKDDPDHLPWITEEDVRSEYDAMGTNFVRLILQWQALEPEPGVYDEDYLDAVAERVGWYEDLGYHVLLDMHQDLYGRFTDTAQHSGNGAPAWATHTDNLPVRSLDQWELVYLEPGVMRAFDHFWGTTGEHPELMDAYADAWAHVAARFSDEPAVIGYDLMNEPFGGSLQGPDFETGPLAELYRRCLAGVREVDQDTWVFVEGQAVGVNWGLPSALPYLEDPREGDARIVYAPHMYALPMDLGDPYEGDAKARIDASVDMWSTNVRAVGERLQAPVVLGEFGLDMSGAGATDFVERMLAESETMAAGRAYWSNDLDGWGPWEGRARDEELVPGPLARVMDRAYPRAVAGEPRGWSYDAEAGELMVRYAERDTVSGSTELYLPQDPFGAGPDEGFTATVDTPAGEGAWTGEWDEELRVLHVTVDGATDGDETTVTITVG